MGMRIPHGSPAGARCKRGARGYYENKYRNPVRIQHAVKNRIPDILPYPAPGLMSLSVPGPITRISSPVKHGVHTLGHSLEGIVLTEQSLRQGHANGNGQRQQSAPGQRGVGVSPSR